MYLTFLYIHFEVMASIFFFFIKNLLNRWFLCKQRLEIAHSPTQETRVQSFRCHSFEALGCVLPSIVFKLFHLSKSFFKIYFY